MAGMEDRLTTRMDGIETRFTARVEGLETRFDKLEKRVVVA